MENRFTRFLSMFLALVMVFTMLPASVLAVDGYDISGMTDAEVAVLSVELQAEEDYEALQDIYNQLVESGRLEAVEALLPNDEDYATETIADSTPATVTAYKQVDYATDKMVDAKYYEYVGTVTNLNSALESAATMISNSGAIGGLIEISAGTLTVTNRQDISMANIIIKGAGKDATTITGNADNFNNSTNGLKSKSLSSEYKAILGLHGDNIKVMDLSIDAGSCGYASGSIIKSPADLTTVRVNAGTTYFENVVISGKIVRSNLIIGTSSTSSVVHANYLTVNAPNKYLGYGSAIDKKYGQLNSVNSDLGGALIGSYDNLGEGYYKLEYMGVVAYTTIPYAIETYNSGTIAASMLTSSLVDSGTTVVQAMTNDLTTIANTGVAKLLYGYDCAEMRQLAVEFTEALKGLAKDAKIDATTYLQQLSAALKIEDWHNVDDNGTCTNCGATGLKLPAPEVEVEIPSVEDIAPDVTEEEKKVISEVIEELKQNEAVKDFVPENLPEGSNLSITLTGVEVKGEQTKAPEKITYDVKPIDKDNNVTVPTGAVTFRLPIPASVTKPLASVYHNGVLMGTYKIQGAVNGKFVEVTTTSFSTFTVEMEEAPKATVTQKDAILLTQGEHNYNVWPNGSLDKNADRPVQIVVNFKATETLEECLAGKFSKYLVDFYLKVEGINGDSIDVTDWYLAGFYESFGWYVIPNQAGDVMVEGAYYPIVSNYDATLNYKDICKSVKDFTAAIYIPQSALDANPNMTVTLELRMTNPNDSTNVLVVGDPLVYDVADLVAGLEYLGKYQQVKDEHIDKIDDVNTNTAIEGEKNEQIVEDLKESLQGVYTPEQIEAAVTEVVITFQKMEYQEDKAPTSVTYDVTPTVTIGNTPHPIHTFDEPVTFRLPVHVSEGFTKANVYHDGKLMGVYAIREENGITFVEVSSSTFSAFTVEPVAAFDAVAQIGDKYYETLQAAIEDAKSGDEIILLADVAEDVTVPAGQNIVLDLAGFDIVGTTNAITNNGTLTINDSVGTGNVYTTDVSAQGRATIVNNGTLIINGGWFGDSNNDTTDRNAINRGNALKNFGEATINGGYFTNVSNQFIGTDAYAYAINNLTGGTITINNATVYGDINGLIFADGKVVVNDGSFTLGRPNEENNLWYLAYGNVEIKGGTWTRAFKVPSWNTGYYIFTGAVKVSGGVFNVEIAEAYLAEGFELKDNGNGTYGVQVEKTYVAEVNGVKYESLQAAIEAAKSGDEIILLADVAEDVTVPAGVIFNGNGKQVGNIVALGDITFKGHTKALDFDFKYSNSTVNIGEGACLELTGTARLVIGHGCTFNITGTITDAKTADKATIQPSLIVAAGASFTGTNLNFNVTNAYIKFNGNSTSKNSSANGTFNFNVTNSIWEQTGVLAFYVPTQGKDPTFNFTAKDSVLTTTSHLVFSVTKGEIVFDNTNVNVGSQRQIENRSTMTIKNGSVVNGAVATSSNAINPGTIIVENATYAVTGQFSGAAEGTGTLILKKGANVSVGSIVDKANIQIDATGMTAGDVVNFTGNLSKFTGTIEAVNNDKLEAKLVDGKIVLAEKPVAMIGETGYATIQAAINAAQTGDIVVILPGEYSGFDISNKNITIQGTLGANGEYLTVIKGGNPAITGHGFNGTIKDIKIVDAFKVMYAEPVGNVTVDNVYVTGATYGFHLVAYSDGLTWTIQNSYMDLSWANSFGVYGNGDAAIVIKNNEFASTSPYYPEYGALAVNTFMPNVTVEDNIFGEDTRIMLRSEDTSKVNIATNYYADGYANAYAEDSTAKVDILDYYAELNADGTINKESRVELPRGNNFTGYTSTDAIWGEVWGNAKESFVIKVLDANGNVMGTTSLNNVGGIINGNVNVSWNLKLDAESNTDEYWTMSWTTAPSIDNMPAKVELWVDGVKVSSGNVVLNGPDDLNKIVSAVADGEGKILSFHTTLAAAIQAKTTGNVVCVLRNVNENLAAIKNVTFITNVAGGVTITNTATDDEWIAFENVTIGSGVTLISANVLIGGASENVIEGTLIAGLPGTTGAHYYQKSDAKTTIRNGGKVIVNGDVVLRYNNNNTDAGIFIYGDNNAETVEFSTTGYIGAYSGAFYAENAVVATGTDLRLDYHDIKNGVVKGEESDDYAPVVAEFVNSTANVTGQLRLYKDAHLVLTNSQVNAGTVQTRQMAKPVISIDSNSAVKANAVEVVTGTFMDAILNADGTVSFKPMVAQVGAKTYSDLQAAIDAANGATVELLVSIVVNQGETLVIDLKGQTVEHKVECSASYDMIAVKGELTITDSVGGGKLSLIDDGVNAGSSWASYTITNRGGKITIEGGIIENIAKYSTGNANNAIFNYDGDTVINGGTFNVPYSRSLRLWYGSMTINGGTFDGQVWVQAMGDCTLTINGGSFKPGSLGNDGSSVYVTASNKNVTVSITDGEFATKIGCDNATKLAGCITGGTFTETAKNNTNAALLAEGKIFAEDGNGTYGVVVDPAYGKVAQIGDQYYTTLAEAIAAAQNGETVKLLKDVALTDTLTLTKSITIDGNGHVITPADATKTYNSAFMVGDSGWGDDHGENITLKNIKFSGFKTNYGVVRAQGVTLAVENCEFTGCDVKNAAYAVLSLNYTDATVTGTKFVGNLERAVDVNYNADSSTAAVVIDGCTFEGNTTTGAGIVYRNAGKLSVKNSIFKNNTVNTNGNAATLYAGWGSGDVISGCTFEGNTVITSHTSTKRFASAIFCDGCAVSGNVFGERNTATRNGETISTIVAVGAYYGAADISGNYWGGEAPVAGVDYTVEFTRNDAAINSYYADEALTNEITIGNVAKVGKYYYTSLADAIAAAQNGETVTLLADVALTSTLKIAPGKDVTLDLNGKTVSGVNNTNQGSLIYIENTGKLTVKDSAGNGKITYAQGSSNVGWTVDVKGEFVLESGTIELTGNSWNIGYAVDVRPNSWGTEYTTGTKFVMNGGQIISSDGAVRVASSSAAGHKNVSASFEMNGGLIDAAWDGVFIQQSDAIYDDLSFTITGGTIESDLNPVRVYGPAPTGYVNDNDCMSITLAGGTLNYTGTETYEWVIQGILRAGGGSSVATIVENGDLVVSSTIAQNATAPEGYKWVETTGGYTLAECVYVAQVGETKYETLQAAINAGGEVKLLTDIVLTETVTVAKGNTVTLNLNGKTISAHVAEQLTKSFAVIANKGKLTITDSAEGGKISVSYGGASFGYGIGLYAISNEGGELTIAGGTVENLTTVSGSMYDAIDNNSTLGKTVLNITGGVVSCPNYIAVRQFCNNTGAENIVNISGGVVTGGNTSVWMQNPNSYDNKGALNITDGTVNGRLLLGSSDEFDAAVSGGTFDVAVPEEYCAEGYIPTENANGTYGVKPGAYVAEVNGVKYETLQAAIDAAGEGDTITLLKPIVVAAGETLTLDLTGKTLVYNTAAAGEAMITNNGTLTLIGGTVAYTYSGAATTAKAANAISNHGTLTVNGTNVSNTTASNGQIGYAIDNFGMLTVNGGEITATGSNYYDGIRMFCASESVEVSVIVNGGKISSIWMQNASDGSSEKNTKDVLGSLTITGGEIANVWLEPSSNFEASISGGYVGKVAYNQTASGRDLTGFITGGTFGMDVSAFVADGYECKANGDGTYGVEEKAAMELFDIGSSSIVLGNELAMYFYISNDVLDGTDYIAVITKTYADRESVVVEVPFNQWENASNNRKRFRFDGIAAKEMGDDIVVVIKDSEGNILSTTYTDSIQKYVERGFDSGKATGELATMLVDMLNYGAAAQGIFTYNTTNLANANMGNYQHLATQNVNLNNNQVKGNGFKSMSAVLESNISLTMFFDKAVIDRSMTAVVTFEDHFGAKHELKIVGSQFEDRGSKGWAITINELVVADGCQLITCKFLDANNVEVEGVYGIDSLESMCARAVAGGGGSWYEDIMKFSISAYNYFH